MQLLHVAVGRAQYCLKKFSCGNLLKSRSVLGARIGKCLAGILLQEIPEFDLRPFGRNRDLAIEHIDLLLGLKDAAGNDVPTDKRPDWALIHFNVGLGDLIYCVPNIKSHRVLPHNAGGVIRTDAMQYEKNLDTLARLLRQKAPGAKIVWASTTPIRHSRENVFKLGTEIEYNNVAARVMKKHAVPINDMYTFAKGLIDMDKPAGHGVDPFFFDRKPLHPPIVQSILAELSLE